MGQNQAKPPLPDLKVQVSLHLLWMSESKKCSPHPKRKKQFNSSLITLLYLHLSVTVMWTSSSSTPGQDECSSVSGFLSLSTLTSGIELSFVVHCRMFSNILAIYPLDASTPSSYCDLTKYVSDIAKWMGKSLQLRNMALYWNRLKSREDLELWMELGKMQWWTVRLKKYEFCFFTQWPLCVNSPQIIFQK